MGRQTCGWLNLFVQLGQTSFFIAPLLSKTPPPSARSPRRWPLRHDHRSRSHQTVLPLQLRLPERNHQKTDDYQSVRRDQRVSRTPGTRAGAIRHARGQRCVYRSHFHSNCLLQCRRPKQSAANIFTPLRTFSAKSSKSCRKFL